MSYTVLARKWRPQTFDDVKGQGAVVATLSRALESGRVSHAYLFTGSRGIGKTTIARIMAKALCCERGVSPRPCGECTACTEITRGNAVDVIEIDGASHTGVDDIRELREAVRFQPQRCRFKVFILDEVHMLSTSAFNALLKTLEEPPPHVKFVFATTEPHKIPVTILSRCQRYDFKRISVDVIVARLKEILAHEKLEIADDGLAVIARAAEGGMRDALSLTDQVLSFAGERATAEQVTAALGLIDRRTVTGAVDAILARDAHAALVAVDRVFEQGHDLRTLVESIATELRHLTVARATGSVAGFADLSPDDVAAVDARAAAHDGRDLQRLFQTALTGVDDVAESENAKLASELVVLKLCARPPVADALLVNEALLRLDAVVRGRPVPPLAHGGRREAPGPAIAVVEETLRAERPPVREAAPAARPTGVTASPPRAEAKAMPAAADVDDEPIVVVPPTTVSPASAPSSTTTSVDAAGDDAELDDHDPALGLPLEGVDPRMQAFIDELSRANGRVAGHLTHAWLASVSTGAAGPVVTLGFKNDQHHRVARDASKDAQVKGALVRAFGDGATLEIAPVGDADDRPPTLAEAQAKALADVEKALDAHARAHPIVQRALELFGGEVRSVRRS